MTENKRKVSFELTGDLTEYIVNRDELSKGEVTFKQVVCHHPVEQLTILSITENSTLIVRCEKCREILEAIIT